TSDFEGSYCTDAIVTVGIDTYTSSNPSGTTTISNFNGCDSIITVDLIFQDVAIGNFSANKCSGDSVFIYDAFYNESDIIDELLIDNGSINGCDSLIIIDVTFEDIMMGLLTTSICLGDTIFVGNLPYTEPVTDEEIMLLSADGCDSLLILNITVTTPTTSIIDESVCENYQLIVNGTLYDKDNPTGSELIENIESGCDSIVEINLVFDQIAIDSAIVYSTCDVTDFILVGGFIFNMANPSGIITLFSADTNACDTIVSVDITFGVLDVDYNQIQPGCSVPDSGSVIINGITGIAPFNITYGSNNAIAFSLPVQIDLGIGSGNLIISDASGCETTISYTIVPGDDQNITINQNGEQLLLSGVTIDSILWSPTDGLSCNDCFNPIATPTNTTTYIATVFYEDGCTLMDTINVIIEDNIPDYVVPNIFSPNSDSNNDNFTLTVTDGALGVPLLMTIYDRWGNKQYTSNIASDIINTGWDGTNNNKNVEVGVYVFYISLVEPDGTIVNLFGDLTVIR
ncbi:MAG: gliding motility-associated C-terminal domain-containing protein, partial [Saprospiraceae bacterium]